MARTEVIERRTAQSKTFDNADGTFTLESGSHHHHLKNGAWVDTDLNWAEFVDNLDWDTAADVTRVTWEMGQLWDYDVSETGTVLTWDNAEDMTRRWGGRHRGPTE